MIPETFLKIKRGAQNPEGKSALRNVAFGTLGILIVCLSFILGRISALEASQGAIEPISIIYPPLVETNIPLYDKDSLPSSEPVSWAFAASKTGKTYYPKGCSGLARVKPENRVYFEEEQAAQEAGLSRSASCK